MKLLDLFENDLVPPKVMSFMIGKFFAEYIGELLDDIGMASDLDHINIYLDDAEPRMSVIFNADINRPDKPHPAPMRALAKRLELDPRDWSLKGELFRQRMVFEVLLMKKAEFDAVVSEVIRGFESVPNMHKRIGNTRVEYVS